MAFINAPLPSPAVGESRALEIGLTRACAAGDVSAQRRLLGRVLDRVRSTTRYLAGPCTESEDLTQLVLIQIIHAAGSFRGESSLDYWVDRVTVQTAAKYFEKKRRRKSLRDSVWQPGPEIRNAEDEAALSEVRHRLSKHFHDIAAEQRAPLVLHYLFGYDVSEIADITETGLHTVRGRLRTGLKRIRQKILADPALREWVSKGDQ
jgi:RNA polymerase sigma-70 factor (ECF subfamily)